jgi:hypothetical protein
VLKSPLFDQAWVGQMVKAFCYATAAHAESPEADCGCGIYGQFNILDSFESILPTFDYFTLPKGQVNSIGVVVLTEHFGKIQVHSKGLRSEYARVKGLVIFREDLVTFDGYHELAKRSAQKIGVGVFGSKIAQAMIDDSLRVNGL